MLPVWIAALPPLRLDPRAIEWRRAVGRGASGRNSKGNPDQLFGNGGLADLPGTDQDMHDRRRCFQDALEVMEKLSLVCHNDLVS